MKQLTYSTVMKNIKPQPYDVSHLPELNMDHPPHLGGPHIALMFTLHEALTVKRPNGGGGEARFAASMANIYHCTMIDAAGNLHFDRRRKTREGKSLDRTLFTAHTDTVHHKEGINKVRVDGKFWRADGDVLGADDGAGIALLAHMMSHDVPGYYIMFRGEECGGVGSTWLADNMPELLEEFDRAIAFDRAGYYDVITHQGGTRCCSDEFANALAEQLSFDESGLMFAPSDEGVYTDTAEFVGHIPECTNISVGYKAQHSHREEQDIVFLKQLADNLVLVKWDLLPTKRNPRIVESKWERYDRIYNRSNYFFDKNDSRDEHNRAMTRGELDAAFADDETIFNMDADEFDLYCALEEFVQTGNTPWLLDLVANHVSPGAPQLAQMTTTRLDAELVETSLDLLNQGFSAGMVADEIYDVLRTN